jgi:hypothetical protein
MELTVPVDCYAHSSSDEAPILQGGASSYAV